MSFTSVDASDREHAQVAAMLVDLILNYAGNYSNLILDPDLDSYWLMDAYITKLPLLMDTQTKASLLGPARRGRRALRGRPHRAGRPLQAGRRRSPPTW